MLGLGKAACVYSYHVSRNTCTRKVHLASGEKVLKSVPTDNGVVPSKSD